MRKVIEPTGRLAVNQFLRRVMQQTGGEGRSREGGPLSGPPTRPARRSRNISPPEAQNAPATR